MSSLDGFVEAGQAGDSWDGEKPVQGIYIAKKTNVGRHSSNVYVLDVNGTHISVWGSTVIDGKFEEIPLNSEVYVEALGEAKSKTGGTYKDYKVLYKKAITADVEKAFPDAEVV